MEHGRASWVSRRSEVERRRDRCELPYDLEVEYRKVGWGDPAFVHDEERELFRFHDGRFAFSREHATGRCSGRAGGSRDGSSTRSAISCAYDPLAVGDYDTAINTNNPTKSMKEENITPRMIAPTTANAITLRLTMEPKATFASSGRSGS